MNQNPEPPTGSEARVQERRAVVVAGFEAAGIYGAQILEKFADLDAAVYEGMSRLAGEQLDSLGDISAKLGSYSHTAWSGLTDPALEKVTGHVAEAVSAQQLEVAGLGVQWPGESNQPGWDLLVQGHETNVKLVSDASALTEHFEQYPNIPVIVPGDAANIPDGAVYFDPASGVDEVLEALGSGGENIVLVDTALSKTELTDQVEDATDFGLGAADSVGIAFPLVTFAFSGWRSAITNVAVDVSGVAIGGGLAAKLGALVGSVAGPIGTGVGAVLFGIIGAMIGRGVAQGIRQVSLFNAIDRFKMADRDLRRDIAEEERLARQRLQEYIWTANASLQKDVWRLKAELRTKSEIIQLKRADLDQVSQAQACQILDEATGELEKAFKLLTRSRHGVPWWRRWLWPNVETIAIEKALREHRRRRRQLARIVRRLPRTSNIDKRPLFTELSSIGLASGSIKHDLRTAAIERRRLEAEFRQGVIDARSGLAKQRWRACQRVGVRLSELRETIRRRLQAAIRRVEQCAREVRVEMAKLGHNAR
jgi:hypothetical protein